MSLKPFLFLVLSYWNFFILLFYFLFILVVVSDEKLESSGHRAAINLL